MIFNRQRLLLALLDAHGGELAAVDFQKLLMLYTLEWESTPSYEFVPYKYGGFSFTSYADKRKLTERGYLSASESEWALTARGRKAAQVDKTLAERTRRFYRQHSNLRGDALVAEVYRRYPYYAIRSEIVGRVLKRKADKEAVSAAQPPRRRAGLATIGYEGKTLEAYLNQLIGDGVTVLCDVRRNPISRKYGFSKNTLAHACETVGIRYEHLPELGIPSEARQSLRCQADYDQLFADYRKTALRNQPEAIRNIAAWVEKRGQRVALTCFELHAHQCHRHCLSESVERRLSRSGVKHL